MKPYEPTAIDVAWARNLVALTTNNAVWAWPDTGLVYRLDHPAKTLILTNPELLTDKYNQEGHDRTIQVFKLVGYTVKLVTIQ